MYNTSIAFQLTGTSALLLSSDKLADPLNKLTIAHKKLTSKRNKTEEDHLAIARSQWEGCLYLNDKGKVVMPTANIRACLVGGGKFNKLGQHLKRGTIIWESEVVLDYGKSLSVKQLWESNDGADYVDRRSVIVGKARVIAYRPKFIKWKLEFIISYDQNILDAQQITDSLITAGQYVGLGGFRPEKGGTFGRFEVKVI